MGLTWQVLAYGRQTTPQGHITALFSQNNSAPDITHISRSRRQLW